MSTRCQRGIDPEEIPTGMYYDCVNDVFMPLRLSGKYDFTNLGVIFAMEAFLVIFAIYLWLCSNRRR